MNQKTNTNNTETPLKASEDMTMKKVLLLSLQGAKANLWPGLLIWLFATVIVIGYYNAASFQEALNQLGAFRKQYGLYYAIPSLAICAGLIPFCLQIFQKDDRADFRWQFALFLICFWGYKGAEIDYLYHMQAVIFGDNAEAKTLLFKVMADQLIYVPIWAVPTLAIALLWANKDFNVLATKQALGRDWYMRIVMPILIPNFIIWIPAVTLIYMMPEALQLPFQNLVACLFSCLVMFVARHEDASTQSSSTP